jgi:hypothetical protein
MPSWLGRAVDDVDHAVESGYGRFRGVLGRVFSPVENAKGETAGGREGKES